MLSKVTNRGRPLSYEKLKQFEVETGATLPESYREFLIQYNGGQPSPDAFPIQDMPLNEYGIIQALLGIETGHEWNDLRSDYNDLRGRMPATFVPIAYTPSGDFLCLDIQADGTAPVVFWDWYAQHHPPTYANVYGVAPSFEDFLDSLFLAPESQCD